MSIHEALMLIDEWVDSLEDDELPEKCREAGNDFFSFLQHRGFNPDIFVRVVREVTGQTPQNLWRNEDAQRERRAEDNTHWFMLQTGRGDEYMERKLDRLSVTGENLTE